MQVISPCMFPACSPMSSNDTSNVRLYPARENTDCHRPKGVRLVQLQRNGTCTEPGRTTTPALHGWLDWTRPNMLPFIYLPLSGQGSVIDTLCSFWYTFTKSLVLQHGLAFCSKAYLGSCPVQKMTRSATTKNGGQDLLSSSSRYLVQPSGTVAGGWSGL